MLIAAIGITVTIVLLAIVGFFVYLVATAQWDNRFWDGTE